MSPGRRRRTPPLTLVTSSGSVTHAGRAGAERNTTGQRDWTALMARAQDGDRQAYRTLLEDITPFLRALAARCFKDPSDIEDATQDVLLTVHAVRTPMIRGVRSGPGLLPLRTGASSTGCGARYGTSHAK
jgi:hypothetical protein